MAGERLQSLSDEALLGRYCQGEAEALRVLIERYHDDLLRFLVRLTGDRHMAEDVFQETWLQVAQSAPTFDIGRRFRPWLLTIGANKGRDALRRKMRRPALELSAPVGGSSDEGATTYVDLLELDVPGPDSGLLRSEQERLVQQALEQLSDPLREILLLAYFQRLSYAQIAEDLEIPLGTVKSRLHAAVAAFAKAWQQIRPASRDEPGPA
ncbi:MAG: sigma-70 family RNA polymerase sigma factor [Planctomycetota bacterium]|nr:sigma-70 family RNA polymerase sigma factor [Planctomycetota bacterium]